MEFRRGLPIVGDVLEHVAAQNDVELPSWNGKDVMSVSPTFGERG